MKTIPVTSVFHCMSGNSGLTEEFIYTKLATQGTLYEVLSSATVGITRLGFIPTCIMENGRPLRVFEDKQGILIARNGKAGQMTYLKPSKYTINDHAYILSLREDFRNEYGITTADSEKRFLLWFMCTHQSKVYEYSSKTANATWNKSDFVKMSVTIPDQVVIDKVAVLYEDSLQTMGRVQRLLDSLENLLRKQIEMGVE